LPILTFGQEPIVPRLKKNHLALNLGPMHTRLIDNGYSTKLLLRGTTWKFDLEYGRETDKYLFNFNGEVSVGNIKSRSEDLPSDFYFVNPSLEYSRKIKHLQVFKRPLTFLTGLNLSSANYVIINQPIFDNATTLSFHGAYINMSGLLDLNEKQRLQLSYKLPTTVYINYNVWNGGASDFTQDDKEHLIRALTTRGSFHYFNLLKNIQLHAAYEWQIGRNARFLVLYKFRYVSSLSEPRSNIYSNELTTSLKILF
jgi:hypothetical protein